MQFTQSSLASLSLCILLSACTSNSSNLTRHVPFLGHHSGTFSSVIEDSFRGQLYYDGDNAHFLSCNNEVYYNINKNKALHNIYQNITDDNDEPVYVEFSGELVFSENEKSTSSVNINVQEIYHMALAKASLQCAKPTDNFKFKAKGDTPYWRINISDNTVFFATKAINQSYPLKTLEKNNNGTYLLVTNNTEEEQFTLEVIPEHCYTQNGKEYWGYQATVQSLYGEFTGCGEFGHINNNRHFTGYYLSQYQDQETSLRLNKDKTLEYKQMEGESLITKSGFWKSNTFNSVVIMFSQKNNHPIQEEIVLHRQKSTLFAYQINHQNTITKFEQPLAFKLVNKEPRPTTLDSQRQFTTQKITPKKEIDLEVKTAIKQYFKIHDTDPKNIKFNSVRFDLNGDGKDEAIALLDWCPNEQCEMLIFEASEHGLSFTSRTSAVQTPLIVSQLPHFSWQSLVMNNKGQWQQLDFDGQSYPLHSQASQNLTQLEHSSDVILFSEGKPTEWFLIK